MSRTSTPSHGKDSEESALSQPHFAVGDKVWVEIDGYTIGGPYWITEIETSGGILPYYFYKIEGAPEDEIGVVECMPEWWLSSTPNIRDPDLEGGDDTFGMEEARKRSEMIHDMIRRAQAQVRKNTTKVGESAVGSSAKGQAPKTTTKEDESAVGSNMQRQVPKIKTEEGESEMKSIQQDETK